jgi:phage FluMu protein Com
MAISLVCECGKALSVRDEMAGKRVKCPACQTIMTVPADGGGEAPGPKRKASKGNGGKKGNKTLWIAAGAAVLVLGFCCVGMAGAGAWWFFFRGPSGLEAKIIGKWVPDNDSLKKGTNKGDELFKLVMGGDIQFKADGKVIDNTPMTPITEGKWRTVSTKGDVITVELSQSIISKKLDIRVVDNDHLKITPADTKMEFAFKRASP